MTDLATLDIRAHSCTRKTDSSIASRLVMKMLVPAGDFSVPRGCRGA